MSALIESTLGIEPRFEVNPDLIVAMGAAVQAGNLAGLKSHSILVDITPHTFSTGTIEMNMFGGEEICVPLIKRNSPLPCRKAEVFSTLHDKQEEVRVEVYQGEGRLPEDNTLLGDFMVTGLSRVPAGNPIVLQFDLDLNGMLKATATEKSTGLSKEVVIDTSSQAHSFDLETARKNIAAFSDHVQEAVVVEEEGGSHEAQLVEAKQLRKRSEILIARGIDAEDETEIQDLVNQTITAVKASDWETVTRLNQTLSDVIFYLED